MRKISILMSLVVLVIIVSTPIHANNSKTDILNTAEESLNWNNMKKMKADLSTRQKEILNILGYDEKEIKSFTNEDIREIIITNKLSVDQMEKISGKKVSERIKESKVIIEKFENIYYDLGYNEENIRILLDNAIFPDSNHSKEYYDKKLEKILKNSSNKLNTEIEKTHTTASIKTTGDHKIYDVGDPTGILISRSGSGEPDPVPFHNYTFDDYYGSNFTSTYGVDCPSGTGYTKKYDYVLAAISAAGNISDGMYKATGGLYNYNMYGEKTGSNIYHEGVDIYKSKGSDIYAPKYEPCIVIGFGTYSNGITYVNLYIAELGFTITYEHLTFNENTLQYYKDNNTDVKGLKIGVESDEGPVSTHTHVEVADGYKVGAYSNTGVLEAFDLTLLSYHIY